MSILQLCVVALLLAAIHAAVFNVEDYGAVGDGKTLNTDAIKKAISALDAAGGGTLLFPPGNFITGPLNMTSNMVFSVSSGATVLAVQDITHFKVVAPFPSYGVSRETGTTDRYEPFIGGWNLKNIEISGGGVIDGQGSYWWNLHKQGALLHQRPTLIEPVSSQHIEMHSITFQNSMFWNLHPIYCDDVHIHDIVIRAPSDSPNTDGIDPDSTTNVLVENVDISNGDDMIAIKSGFNMAGILFNRPSANITIRNSVLSSGHGISIGSEGSGGVHNVTFYNCTIKNAAAGPRLKTSRGRGGVYSDIVFDSIILDNPKTALLTAMNYDKIPNPGNSTTTPHIYNIRMSNIKGSASKPGNFDCLPESPCYGYVLTDISITTNSKFECQYISGKSTNVSPQSCIN